MVRYLLAFVVMASALATCSWLAGYELRSRSTESHGSVHRTVQIVYSSDRTVTFEVSLRCSLVRKHAMAMEQYTVSSPEVVVIKHELGYGQASILYSQRLTSTYRHLGSEQSPLWNGQYVPHADFVLPSARILLHENQPYVVIVRSDGCEVVKLGDSPAACEIVRDITPLQPALHQLWKTSFAPDDVYWSLGLVTQSHFFTGKDVPAATLTYHTDTLMLHEKYLQLQR